MQRDETLTKKVFEDIFRENRPVFEHIAYSYVGSREEAADIVSDCFTRLWEKRDTVLSESVLSYMYTTVRNACINYRKSARHNNEVYQSLLETEGDLMDIFTETISHSDPSEVFAEDILAITRESLKKVPDEQKEAFLRHRIDGLSYQEIAAALGIPRSRVAKDIHAVLTRLHLSLKDYLTLLILLTLLKNME